MRITLIVDSEHGPFNQKWTGATDSEVVITKGEFFVKVRDLHNLMIKSLERAGYLDRRSGEDRRKEQRKP